MPKVSVYLPDELYRQARERGLSISRVTQDALYSVLRDASNDDWIDRAQARPPRLDRAVDTSRLLEEVRDEFGT